MSEKESEAIATLRRVVREELRATRDEIIRGVVGAIGPAPEDRFAEPEQARSVADVGLKLRVFDFCKAAIKPGQAHGATYVARHLGVHADQVAAAFRELEREGTFYSRPHIKGSRLYYIVGQGPGPVKAGAK